MNMEITMRNRILALALIGVLGACSDSTSPAPTFLGTWHVKVSSFSVDTLEPNPFTITLSAGNGDTLHVAMAPVQWDHGPNYVFDSVVTTAVPSGDQVSLIEKDEPDQYYLGLLGNANVKRDTISGQVSVLDGTLHTLGTGTFVATKH